MQAGISPSDESMKNCREFYSRQNENGRQSAARVHVTLRIFQMRDSFTTKNYW